MNPADVAIAQQIHAIESIRAQPHIERILIADAQLERRHNELLLSLEKGDRGWHQLNSMRRAYEEGRNELAGLQHWNRLADFIKDYAKSLDRFEREHQLQVEEQNMLDAEARWQAEAVTMPAAQVLTECERLAVRLRLEDGGIFAEPPLGNPRLLFLIRHHAEAIKQLLANRGHAAQRIA